jgi:trans-aconitate methyltransferase
VIKRLLQPQEKGAVFALQVPHNLDQPSHVLMAETAAQGPWAEKLAGVQRWGCNSRLITAMRSSAFSHWNTAFEKKRSTGVAGSDTQQQK